MNQAHIRAILEGVIPEVKAAITNAQKPLLDRIEALEKRAPINGQDGKDGRDGEKGETGAQGEAGPAGPEGPAGEVGPAGDRGPQGDQGVPGEPGAQGEPGPQGEKGLDGTSGKDGRDGVDGKDGRDGKDADPALIARLVEEAVAKIPPAADGRDGQPGVPGVPGRDGINGKDGAPGKDGADGLGVSDLDVLYDGKRTFTLQWTNGEKLEKRSFRVPVSIDAGVWKEGAYEAGDQVSFQGHLWVAKTDTDKQPDTAPTDWRMQIRKPRDGRDGKPGERGMQGPRGERGEAGPRAYGG